MDIDKDGGYACFRCRFWVNLPGYDLLGDGKERDNFGECRRYPPQLRDDDTVCGDIGNWPLTESDCYCGEFQDSGLWISEEELAPIIGVSLDDLRRDRGEA